MWNDGEWRGFGAFEPDELDEPAERWDDEEEDVYPIPWAGRTAITDPEYGGVKVTGAPSLALRLGRVCVDGEWHDWTTDSVVFEDGELSSSHAVGSLFLQVRHGFFSSWATRFNLVKLLSREPVRIDHLLVHVETDDGGVAWFHGAGAAASLVVLPTGSGHALGGRIRVGGARPGPDGTIDLGGVTLGGRGRNSLDAQWRFDPYPTPAAFGRTAPGWMPESLIMESREPQVIQHADAALVAAGLGTGDVDGGTELLGSPGSHVVELRDSNGTAEVELCWAPDADELLLRSAHLALSGARLATGVPRLETAGAGLVVRQTLRLGLLEDPEEGVDALDALADRLLRKAVPAPLEVILLSSWVLENSSNDEIREFVQTFRSVGHWPGVGLAGTHMALVCLSIGDDPAPVLEHLSALARDVDPHRDDVDPVCHAELMLVTGGQDAASVINACTAVAADLGHGLPGQRLPGLPLVQRAQRTAVLELVPDQLMPTLTRDWGIAPAVLAEREKSWIQLALHEGRMEDDTLLEALAWIAATIPN